MAAQCGRPSKAPWAAVPNSLGCPLRAPRHPLLVPRQRTPVCLRPQGSLLPLLLLLLLLPRLLLRRIPLRLYRRPSTAATYGSLCSARNRTNRRARERLRRR